MIHRKSSVHVDNAPSLLMALRTRKLTRTIINPSIITIKYHSIITFEILDTSNLNSEDWSGMITNSQLLHKESSRNNTQMTGPIPLLATSLSPNYVDINTFIDIEFEIICSHSVG